jgi:predicted DNA-binding transcriptional regulator YafY
MDAIIDKFGTNANTYAYDMTSFKLEVNVAVNHVFFGWVFGFGGKVRIKAPEDVKKQYKTMIEQVMAEEV